MIIVRTYPRITDTCWYQKGGKCMGHIYVIAKHSRVRGPHWQWQASKLWSIRPSINDVLADAQARSQLTCGGAGTCGDTDDAVPSSMGDMRRCGSRQREDCVMGK